MEKAGIVYDGKAQEPNHDHTNRCESVALWNCSVKEDEKKWQQQISQMLRQKEAI